MQITLTIQSEIQNYLEQHKLNMSQFATKAGLNAGTVSGIVMSNRAISVHQLDCVTKAMEKPEDYFYSRYVQEYMLEASMDWRRVKAFLQRCAELGRLDCIAQVISVLMDNVTYYAPLAFELAEAFFAQERLEAAELLYENLAISEKHQHSERLAICQYRLFKIRIGDDQHKNYDTAVQFEPFIERLDELEQLEALKDLLNAYRSLRKWDKVKRYADTLEIKAEIQHKLIQNQSMNNDNSKRVVSPPFAYWAFSHLLRAEVYEAYKDYDKALQHTYAYSDLTWVQGDDESTLDWKRRYQEWAEANSYVNRLHAGEVEVLADYVRFFSSNKSEILAGLDNVIEAANRHQLDIDQVLEQFKMDITTMLDDPEYAGAFNQQIFLEKYIHFTGELAVYYFNKSDILNGFTFLLGCLEKSSLINNNSYIIKCVKLYESYQEYASPDTKIAYRKLINGVNENER